MRASAIERNTAETKIKLSLNLDGTGESTINSGCGFLDHMLTLFAKHGRFDLTIECLGDTQVDYHHTVEDIGIVLGRAFNEALGDKKGIERYGDIILPMDEALILTAVDLSGRAYLGYGLDIPTEKVGDFDTELVKEFWLGFIRTAECTLHIKQLAGGNSHHIIEGAFKAAARSISKAVKINPDYANEIPSTKGVL
ncbi:MAG: imidazoleglycerol-phosphate dehydratase HisB [Oscillospiraceae bacterium]|nr:imidazoleglycerol-phosphate dehydratase HisB [Oscillospiraceae bacterium]